MKKLVTVVSCMAVLLLVTLTITTIYPYLKARNMPLDIADKVLNADEAIRTYEWFKEQEAFINTCLKNEVIAKDAYDDYASRLPEDMKEWTSFMSKEEASLRASHVALQKLTNRAIEDYNAKASMVHKSIFKDLPTNIGRSVEDATILIFGSQED